MKNKSLLPILIATFALTACALPNPSKSEDISSEAPTSEVSSIDPVSSSEIPVSSSEAPSSTPVSSSSVAPSSSEAPVTYGVAIANKTAFGEWYAGATRDLDINLTPAANVLQELNKKNLTVTSSNPEVVKVQGVSLAALKAGTAKITVAYHGATDTLDVTILDNSAKAKYGVAHEGTADDPFTNEEAIKVTKSEKYEGEDYYVGGIVESFYHAPGSRTDGVVSYFLKPATEGGEKFEIYKCVKEDGTYLTDDDIWKNGYAIAHGPFTTYGSQCETTSAKFLSCEGNKPDVKKTIEATFAEAFAVGAELSDGDSTYDMYKFTGYVTKKSGNNFFLTATKGEEIVKGKSDAAHGERDYDTNAIELYFASAPSADITAKLLQDAKVTVTMNIKNYHGEIENSNVLTADDIIVVEAGQQWAVPEPAVSTRTLAEFIAGENTKTKAYYVTADIKAFKSASTKDAYGNMTLTDGTNDLIIYGATATASALAWDNAESYAFTNPKDFMTNTVTKDLAIGQTLKMKLIRADYTDSKTGTTTIEGTGIILEVSGQGQQQEEVPEPTVETKTLAEFIALENKANKAYEVTAQLKSFKNGAAVNDAYGNLVVTDGTNDLVVYGSTATASALVWNKADAYVFTNPKDFQTNALTKDIAIGQTLKMKLIRADYSGAVQANAIILEVSGNGSQQEEVPEPTVETKTLAEFIALENKVDKAYSVTANIKAFKSGSTKDKYGNMTLTDGTNDLIVYGSTMSADALVWDKASSYVFTNPQNFLSTPETNALQIGNEITMKLTRCDYVNSKTSEVTIEGNGVITAITPVAATSVSLDKETVEVTVGDTLTLTPTINPTDCNQVVTWTSSDETVATVENGKVTAVAAGTAKIKVAVGSFEAECTVTVTAPEVGVEKATLKFTGTTNTDAKTVGTDLTANLNLDPSIFTVTYAKNSGSADLALRTDGIRMYGYKQKADGNELTVSIASGYTIKSINIAFDSDDYAKCAVVSAGDAVVSGTNGAYEIDETSFKIVDDNSSVSANTQVRFQSIDIKYAAAAPVEEIAQPVGSYNGYAIGTDDSNIFSNIALGDNKAYVEIGSYAKGIFDFTFDKTTGLLSIALGGVLGNLSAKYDAENDKLVEGKVDGAGAAALKNNGSIELNAAKLFCDCDGTTEELQAMFKRRYMSGSWQVDTSNADRFESYENGICGKAMKRRGYSGGAVAVNLANDLTPIEVSSIGFWVYNSGENDLTLRMWIYKGAGLTNNAEIGSVTAKAGQWSYCRMGFTAATIYNFQIADFNNSGVALVFDNICLF